MQTIPAIVYCVFLALQIVAEEVARPAIINNCPAASIEAASVTSDKEGGLNVEITVKNTGLKSIRGVDCRYRTEAEIAGYSVTTDYNERFVWDEPTAPGEQRKFSLFDAAIVPKTSGTRSGLVNSKSTLMIRRVVFADGSEWVLADEVKRH